MTNRLTRLLPEGNTGRDWEYRQFAITLHDEGCLESITHLCRFAWHACWRRKSLLITGKHKSDSDTVRVLSHATRYIIDCALDWVRWTWTALNNDSSQDGIFWPLTLTITPERMNNTSSSKANCQKRIPPSFGKEMYDLSHDTAWQANLLCHLLTPCWPATQLKLNRLLAWNA